MSHYEEMFALVGLLGPQMRDGYAAGHAALGAARAEPPSAATISALGGSAIGGSLAEALWRDSARVPISVNRAATLPGPACDLAACASSHARACALGQNLPALVGATVLE